MGTDIHAHVEVKREGKWLHFNAPHVIRHYPLFTKMAGVREVEGVEPIAAPRGIPEDISDITRVCWEREKDDAHDAGYLTRAEIRTLAWWYDTLDTRKTQGGFHGLEGVFGYIDGSPLHSLGGESREMFDDVRIVFWFDC